MSVLLSPWGDPPSTIKLARGEVHLWRFRIDLSADVIAGLKPLLSSDELLRAERLFDPLKSISFVAARGRLRQILARYLDLQPAAIEFSYGVQGKPRLAAESDQQLSFNLSHAGNWGLLAVASGLVVGVDIEKIDSQLEYEKMAGLVFSPAEVACLGQYARKRRRRAFYRIWTRNEARLKGQGGGFSTPSRMGQGTGWRIRSFSVHRDYLGALALATEVIKVQRWHLH